MLWWSLLSLISGVLLGLSIRSLWAGRQDASLRLARYLRQPPPSAARKARRRGRALAVLATLSWILLLLTLFQGSGWWRPGILLALLLTGLGLFALWERQTHRRLEEGLPLVVDLLLLGLSEGLEREAAMEFTLQQMERSELREWQTLLQTRSSPLSSTRGGIRGLMEILSEDRSARAIQLDLQWMRASLPAQVRGSLAARQAQLQQRVGGWLALLLSLGLLLYPWLS